MDVKKLIFLVTALVLLVVPMASAQSTNYLNVNDVRINNVHNAGANPIPVDKGEDIKIELDILAGSNNVENFEIEAYIAGYRYAKYERNLVSDFLGPLDLDAGNEKSYTLNLGVPYDMEQKDAKLRVVISDENGDNVINYNYQLNIEGASESHAVVIKDFFISPSERIEAGRALSFKVKVENIGDRDTLDDVSVMVRIPRLNIQAYETIDEIEVDETQSFEALLLRIPSDAEPGDYEVVATVSFDKYESVEESKTITVTGEQTTPAGESGKTTVTMPESIAVALGSNGAVYPILIQNHDNVARTYVVSVSDVNEWATPSFEPSSVVVVNGGDSKTVYLRLLSNSNAVPGDRVFKVSITSGQDTSETTVLANLAATGDVVQKSNLRSVLEWVLIVLIIVLIVLGLVLVFSRMRKSGKDDDDETQTYY